MMEMLVETLSWAAILSGSAFLLIGAVGTLRFPDFWTRLHALSVTDSAGMILLVTGMALQGGFTLVTVKLILIGLFLFVTGPTAGHALANAALVSGLLPKGTRQAFLDHKKSVKVKPSKRKSPASKPAKKKAKG